jgi:hypothetical protein
MKRCIAIAGLALASLAAQATVVYSNDFDSPATTGAGVTANLSGGFDIATIGGFNATYGNIRRSDGTVSLTLSNLPVHSGLSLSYLLAFLDSWDSRDGGCCSPDNLELRIDGNLVGSYTYNNGLGTIKDIGGGTLLHEYVQFDSNVFWSDTVVDMGSDPMLSFAHTASSITFSWTAVGAGWQGGFDEAFGLDNIVVELRGVQTGGGGTVPEPASLPLAAAAVLGLGVARRRRI